jgi:hypothetical protein
MSIQYVGNISKNNKEFKTQYGKNSIFVQALQSRPYIQNRNLSGFNFFDLTEKRTSKTSVMLKRHLTCSKEFDKLPREIVKTDKIVKFDKKYSSLFKKYGEESKQYLRTHLFQNPCIIKSEECKYLYTSDFVTIS